LTRADLSPVNPANDAVDHLVKHAWALLRQRLAVGDELLAAPFVKISRVNPITESFSYHDGAQFQGQRLVVAKNEYQFGLGGDLCKLLCPVAQDHGLAGARDAVDDAVTVAQASGELLLLQVHDAHDVRQIDLCKIFLQKERALGGNPHFGKHDPAHTIELRQGQRATEAVREHFP